MMYYLEGSIFESPAKVLVNTVNTVGVMGKGIAKTFKQIYPEMFSEYQRLCESKRLTTGKLWLYKTPNKWVLNFPTKAHWRSPSKPEYVDQGLEKFAERYAELGITSVAFPHLGCGHGELDWEATVEPMFRRHLSKLPIDVLVYGGGAPVVPEHRDVEAMARWLRGDPRSLSFDEVWEDLTQIAGGSPWVAEAPGRQEFAFRVENGTGAGLRIRPGKPRGFLAALDALLQLVPSAIRPHVRRREEIFVPQEAMLDLWQAIRMSGFVEARMMPDGLDKIADYVLPILGRLSYLRSVSMTPARVGESPVPALTLHPSEMKEETAVVAVREDLVPA